MVLMQIMTDVTGPESANQSLSVIDLTLKGGFMMIPIVLLSFVAIYIFFERFLTIQKANQDPDAFMHKIQ